MGSVKRVYTLNNFLWRVKYDIYDFLIIYEVEHCTANISAVR